MAVNDTVTTRPWRAGPGQFSAATAQQALNERQQRYAKAGSARVWLHPAAIPLIASFAVLGSLTYVALAENMRKTVDTSRPHGILGPTVNEWLRDDQYSRVIPFRETSLGRFIATGSSQMPEQATREVQSKKHA